MQNGTLDNILNGEKGSYRITEGINRNEHSWLYLAVNTQTDEKVVIKEYRLGMDSSWTDGFKRVVLKYFYDEVSVLKDIGGEGIPKFIDTLEIQAGLGRIDKCIVMEHFSGLSFADLIREDANVSEEVCLDYLVQSLEIVDRIHTTGIRPIVVRDIKPANIIVRENGRLGLIDFGVSTSYIKQTLGQTMAVGTPGYAPLEQLAGYPVPASDIYALGRTFFRLLAGPSVDEADMAKADLDFGKLQNASPRLIHILRKMTEEKVEDRYQSAKEVLADIHNPDLEVRLLQQVKLPQYTDEHIPSVESSERNLSGIYGGLRKTMTFFKYAGLGVLPEQKYLSRKLKDYDWVKAQEKSGIVGAVGPFIFGVLATATGAVDPQSNGTLIVFGLSANIALEFLRAGGGLGLFSSEYKTDIAFLDDVNRLDRETLKEKYKDDLRYRFETDEEFIKSAPEAKLPKFFMNSYSHGPWITGIPYWIAKKTITTLYDAGNVLYSRLASSRSNNQLKQ